MNVLAACEVDLEITYVQAEWKVYADALTKGLSASEYVVDVLDAGFALKVKILSHTAAQVIT
ncbi:hypothetical protein H310_12829 [Aphanomyces invadans]|uniref:Uncharacterized protein n=1 Tax=Aphanomyces invadans TaxID=157072 RepID=A0A024THD1_9STRA|nr:hypothetical protein H310_12829 [Aphanomyces invadans]ETV92991.1 hypothetical protein H310_12829 [Aphanomyces invadans]|eukprot:XP_008878256.1 hypothetical protein H310_12829 [Aphanomyces invadans]